MQLPNLVIAGERRCGTTSLANNLSRHPQIYVHSKRDGGYFVDEFVRKGGPVADWDATHSIAGYKSFFGESISEQQVVICEKSADYLFFRPAHERIARFLPDAKFLFILRNPVARAWSHYWNEVGKKRETLSFKAALEAETVRLAGDGFEGYHHSYVARGFYDESLSDFFRLIPRRNCKVVILENLMSSELSSLNEIAAFLEIAGFETESPRSRSNSNWTMIPRWWAARQPALAFAEAYSAIAKGATSLIAADRETKRRILGKLKTPFFHRASDIKMDSATKATLMKIYHPHINRLEEMIGMSLAVWRKDEGILAKASHNV
jgi:Sulfotransferase family